MKYRVWYRTTDDTLSNDRFISGWFISDTDSEIVLMAEMGKKLHRPIKITRIDRL